MNWLVIGALAGLVYVAIFVYYMRTGHWHWPAMGVALANMFYVLLNLVAPFRGLLDANYAGYNMGLIHVEPGVMVTLVSGSIVVLALASACIALSKPSAAGLWLILFTDVLLLLTVGGPVAIDGLMAPEAFRIELGEFLHIPGMLAVSLGGTLFTAPLIWAIYWCIRQIKLAHSQVPAT